MRWKDRRVFGARGHAVPAVTGLREVKGDVLTNGCKGTAILTKSFFLFRLSFLSACLSHPATRYLSPFYYSVNGVHQKGSLGHEPARRSIVNISKQFTTQSWLSKWRNLQNHLYRCTCIFTPAAYRSESERSTRGNAMPFNRVVSCPWQWSAIGTGASCSRLP